MLLRVKNNFGMSKKSQQFFYIFIVASKCLLQSLGKKIKHLARAKEKQIWTPNVISIFFSPTKHYSPFRMNIVKDACDTNMNIYKKNQLKKTF